MARLVRVETDYRFYVAELTDEQLERYKASDEGADEVYEEVCDNFEFTRDKDGGTEMYLEE
jgi:hypothetical protein